MIWVKTSATNIKWSELGVEEEDQPSSNVYFPIYWMNNKGGGESIDKIETHYPSNTNNDVNMVTIYQDRILLDDDVILPSSVFIKVKLTPADSLTHGQDIVVTVSENSQYFSISHASLPMTANNNYEFVFFHISASPILVPFGEVTGTVTFSTSAGNPSHSLCVKELLVKVENSIGRRFITDVVNNAPDSGAFEADNYGPLYKNQQEAALQSSDYTSIAITTGNPGAETYYMPNVNPANRYGAANQESGNTGGNSGSGDNTGGSGGNELVDSDGNKLVNDGNALQ